ncbi:hypothetical protein J6590_072244 [Homalodisca vitripennis]|nr:hypothetical protein J6590_072244 [Homalodisca vitripennis]
MSDNDPLHSSEIDKELCLELDDEDDSPSDCGSNVSYFTPPASDSGGESDSDVDSLDDNGPKSLQMIFSNSNNNSITNTSVDFMDIDLEDPPSFVQNLLSSEPIAELNTDGQTNNNQSYDNQLHDDLLENDQHQPYDDQPDAELPLDAHDNQNNRPTPDPPTTTLRGRGRGRGLKRGQG